MGLVLENTRKAPCPNWCRPAWSKRENRGAEAVNVQMLMADEGIALENLCSEVWLL
jgi:hypothetical protein